MRPRGFTLVSLLLLAACGSSTSQPDAFPATNGTRADELCTVAAGSVVTLATDVSPTWIVATDHHVYWTELDANDTRSTLRRVDAMRAQPVETVGSLAERAFAIAGSVVLSASGDAPVLGQLGVDGESGSDVSNGVPVGPFGGASFDGSTLFASFHASTRLAQLPLSGAAPVTTVLDPTSIAGIAAADGTGFVAVVHTDGTNDLTTYTPSSAAPTTILTSLGAVTQVVADSIYVYFSSIASDAHTAIYRVRHDGTAKSVVVDDVGGPFAVDGPYVYFAKNGALSRFDQRTATTTGLGAVDTQATPAPVVHGGNVYWAYGSYGGLSGPAHPGAILTTCK